METEQHLHLQHHVMPIPTILGAIDSALAGHVPVGWLYLKEWGLTFSAAVSASKFLLVMLEPMRHGIHQLLLSCCMYNCFHCTHAWCHSVLISEKILISYGWGERTTCASTASSLILRRANARRPLTLLIICINVECTDTYLSKALRA
jgi:hypothetical protein